MSVILRPVLFLAIPVCLLLSQNANAIDVQATIKALRISNTVTGGFLPASDPLFAQMVVKIQSGDLVGAADIAAKSKYATAYLYRRLARQMQTPALDATGIGDNDATAFLIAHFAGTPTSTPSLSSIWSENATYAVVPMAGAAPMRAADLSPDQLQNLDWSVSLVRAPGQNARDPQGAVVPIPPQHVGGYTTLSDRVNDNSFAQYGTTAGTNLRMIEGIWRISTGLDLLDFASTSALAQNVPKFVPEYDPNFFHGQGQAACISCHGGGLASLNHGYAAVADFFNFSERGFTFIATPTVDTMKSLGSDQRKRSATSTCNLSRKPTPVCNPDSMGVGMDGSWNVGETWSTSGALATMGWTGDTVGKGLNELGAAIGKAKIVYQFFTKRVIGEVCPLGVFSADKVNRIAAAANPYLSGTDDIRTIVAMVAADPTCQ